MYGVMTSADTRFFHLVLGLAQTLPVVPDRPLYVYDLGLTPQEIARLGALGVQVRRIPLPEATFHFNSARNIRAVHKMDCIEHYLQSQKRGVLILDADVLVIEPDALQTLAPENDEVVVTYRCDRENKPHILCNGLINSGVMAFGRDMPADFFQTWRDLCEDPEHTDQSALSQLLQDAGVDWAHLNDAQPLNGFRVRVMDGNIYNDTSCRTGRIFHFKSAGRRGNKRMWYQAFVAMLRFCPSLVRALVCLNRRHRFLVWEPSAQDMSGGL